MKIQSLQYALTVAETKSISKAAEKLLLSQPNVSSALKNMEEELGFAIFYRTNKGVAPTAKGREFLQSARKNLTEYDHMTALGTRDVQHQFHLSAGYHSVVDEAFARLCAKYQSSDRLNFSIVNTDPEQIIENVYDNASDLGVLLLPDSAPEKLQSLCEKKDLQIIPVRRLCFHVNLRSGHPLLEEEPFDFQKLRDYPFVDYAQKILSSSSDLIQAGIVDPDKRILVDNLDTRCHIVLVSDAFSVGCDLPLRIRDRYQRVCIPIPSMTYQMVAVHRRDQPLSEEARCYLEFLFSEIAEM